MTGTIATPSTITSAPIEHRSSGALHPLTALTTELAPPPTIATEPFAPYPSSSTSTSTSPSPTAATVTNDQQTSAQAISDASTLTVIIQSATELYNHIADLLPAGWPFPAAEARPIIQRTEKNPLHKPAHKTVDEKIVKNAIKEQLDTAWGAATDRGAREKKLSQTINDINLNRTITLYDIRTPASVRQYEYSALDFLLGDVARRHPEMRTAPEGFKCTSQFFTPDVRDVLTSPETSRAVVEALSRQALVAKVQSATAEEVNIGPDTEYGTPRLNCPAGQLRDCLFELVKGSARREIKARIGSHQRQDREKFDQMVDRMNFDNIITVMHRPTPRQVQPIWTEDYTALDILLGELHRKHPGAVHERDFVAVSPGTATEVLNSILSTEIRQRIHREIGQEVSASLGPEFLDRYAYLRNLQFTGAMYRGLVEAGNDMPLNLAAGLYSFNATRPELVHLRGVNVSDIVGFELPIAPSRGSWHPAVLYSFKLAKGFLWTEDTAGAELRSFIEPHLSDYSKGFIPPDAYESSASVNLLSTSAHARPVRRPFTLIPVPERELMKRLGEGEVSRILSNVDARLFSPNEEQDRVHSRERMQNWATAGIVLTISGMLLAAIFPPLGIAVLSAGGLAIAIGSSMEDINAAEKMDRGDEARRALDDAQRGLAIAVSVETAGAFLGLKPIPKGLAAYAKNMGEMIPDGGRKAVSKFLGIGKSELRKGTVDLAKKAATNDLLLREILELGTEDSMAAVLNLQLRSGVISAAQHSRFLRAARAGDVDGFLGAYRVQVSNFESLAKVPAGYRVAVVTVKKQKDIVHALLSLGDGKYAGFCASIFDDVGTPGFVSDFNLASHIDDFADSGAAVVAGRGRVKIFVEESAPRTFLVENIIPVGNSGLTASEQEFSNRMLREARKNPELEKYMHHEPDANCANAVNLAGEFLRENKFTDIKYRATAIWTNGEVGQWIGHENHFVAMGKRKGVWWVFDPTSAQSKKIGRPLFTTEFDWVHKWQQYERWLMKSKDFTNPETAKTEFDPARFYEPGDSIPGARLLNSPSWYTGIDDATISPTIKNIDISMRSWLRTQPGVDPEYYTYGEIAQVVRQAKSHAVQDDEIENFLKLGAQRKIGVGDLVRQMRESRKVTSRGYPHGFASREQFRQFCDDLDRELRAIGIATGKVRVHGASLTWGDANDVSISVEVDSARFEKELVKVYRGKLRHYTQPISARAANNQVGQTTEIIVLDSENRDSFRDLVERIRSDVIRVQAAQELGDSAAEYGYNVAAREFADAMQRGVFDSTHNPMARHLEKVAGKLQKVYPAQKVGTISIRTGVAPPDVQPSLPVARLEDPRLFTEALTGQGNGLPLAEVELRLYDPESVLYTLLDENGDLGARGSLPLSAIYRELVEKCTGSCGQTAGMLKDFTFGSVERTGNTLTSLVEEIARPVDANMRVAIGQHAFFIEKRNGYCRIYQSYWESYTLADVIEGNAHITAPAFASVPAKELSEKIEDIVTSHISDAAKNGQIALMEDEKQLFGELLFENKDVVNGEVWIRYDSTTDILSAADQRARVEVQLAQFEKPWNDISTSKQTLRDRINPPSPVVVEDSAVASLTINPRQLQKMYKHAPDFGVKTPWGSAGKAEYEDALQKHMASSDTQHIQGAYRATPAVLHYNPNTGLVLVQSPSGEFVSGWKVSPAQAANIIRTGSLTR
ncbi:colicin D domain-containing protein [Nocardia brasiliensis]|uniref:colicin D domain-containing protein n=1 Tax=Nocardia brasiliensis TaxID=37326 RepID=UPI002453E5F6|nr:colicin D domain-containing protein [Nocardia brasiliensis]